MRRAEPMPADVSAPDEVRAERPFVSAPVAYVCFVLAVVLAMAAYSLRSQGIFGCQAAGYGNDRYLAYCNTTHYGDYDYGAFWFDLEPAAIDAARNAQVLFLGNSRMQFGLSTSATNDWFASVAGRYYLLGFSHNANSRFEGPLVHKLRPRAVAYVINLDLFFEPVDTPPARQVMHDAAASGRYAEKRGWQSLHKTLCGVVPAACGNNVAFFRAPATGAWTVAGGGFRRAPVSYDESIDQKMAGAYARSADEFLAALSLPRNCTILTIIPTVNTSIGTARAIATAMGMELVSPELTGLETFDESHLDRESAQRWSAAFMATAAPRLRECLATSSSRAQRAN
jgi:hypothetical protein